MPLFFRRTFGNNNLEKKKKQTKMDSLSSMIQQETEELTGGLPLENETWEEKEVIVWEEPVKTRRPPAQIWWGCPCIKDLMTSPCADQFKEVGVSKEF